MATSYTEPLQAPAQKAARRRVLGLRDVTLFTISAILVIDQLTASASIGPSVLGWWLLTLVLFLVPSALISAELSTAYPDQGGIYVWIKKAFGARMAARTTYWYWVNVALWMPSVFLLFAGHVRRDVRPRPRQVAPDLHRPRPDLGRRRASASSASTSASGSTTSVRSSRP